MGIGGTTFETMSLAALARHFPSRSRALLVSGFFLQVGSQRQQKNMLSQKISIDYRTATKLLSDV